MSSDEVVDFDKEVAELGTLIDVNEVIIEQKPYSPNRAQRRALAKRDRTLKKRDPRV